MIATELANAVIVPRPSFSRLTILEIRHGDCRKTESNPSRFQRLCQMYYLDATQLRLLMGVGDGYIDDFGRIRE